MKKKNTGWLDKYEDGGKTIMHHPKKTVFNPNTGEYTLPEVVIKPKKYTDAEADATSKKPWGEMAYKERVAYLDAKEKNKNKTITKAQAETWAKEAEAKSREQAKKEYAKEYVQQSMQDFYKHPIAMAPGMIFGSTIAPALGAIASLPQAYESGKNIAQGDGSFMDYANLALAAAGAKGAIPKIANPVKSYVQDVAYASKVAGKPKLPTYTNAIRWQPDVFPNSLVEAGKTLSPEQQALTGSWYSYADRPDQLGFYMSTRPGSGNINTLRLSEREIAELEGAMPDYAKGMSGKAESVPTSDSYMKGELIVPKNIRTKAKQIRFDVNPSEYIPQSKGVYPGMFFGADEYAQSLTGRHVQDIINSQYPNLMKIPRKYFPFEYGGWLQKYDRGGDPETPPKTSLSPEAFEQQYIDNLKRRLDLANLIEKEKKAVAAIRANFVPTAKKIDEADDKILREQGIPYQHFLKMRAAKNPEELRKLINTAPQELKYVLPDNGNFNIAQWDKKTNSWNPQQTPARELYCAGETCTVLRKAGAKDIPIIGGNVTFIGKVQKGELPFAKVNPDEAEPGDLAVVHGLAPAVYTDENSPIVNRGHHMTLLAKKPILDAKKNAQKIEAYNAVEGNRLFYGLSERTAGGDDDEHYTFYRYTGAVPKYEKELADIQEYFKNTRLPDMQPIQSRLPQAPEPELKREGGWLDKYDNKYKRGGSKSKSKFTSKNIQSSINTLFARNYDLFGPSGKKYYNPLSKFDDGGQPVFDPTTGMYTLPEVTIEAEAPEWSDLSQEYERTNPLQAFVRGRKEDVIRQSPRGLNKLFGVNPSQFASSIENNIANEYDYLKNTAIIEGIAKSRGIDLSERGDWVDQLSNKEKEILANSKYETLLQPSFYAKSLAGLQELAGYMPGTLPNKYAPLTPGLTKREQEEIHNEKFLGVPTGALNAFQFMDVPGQAIANVLKNRGLSTGSDYRDIPGVLSGKSMGNVNPLDAALMNPFNTVGAPEAVVGLGRGTVALGKGVYQLGKKGYEEAPRIGRFLKQGFNKFENLVGQGFDNLSRQENAMYLDDLYRRGIIDNPNPIVDPWDTYVPSYSENYDPSKNYTPPYSEDYTPPYGNEPYPWDAEPFVTPADIEGAIEQHLRQRRASNVEPSSNQLPPPPSEIILPEANRFRETYNSILGNLRNQFRRSGEILSADDIASRFARENSVNDLYSSSPASSRNNELSESTINSLLGYNQPAQAAVEVIDPITLRRQLVEAIPNKKVKDITDKVLQTNKRSTGSISYYDVLQNDRGGVNPEIRDFDQHFMPTNQLDSRIEDLQTSINELEKLMNEYNNPILTTKQENIREQQKFIINKLQQELEDAKSTKWLRTERVEELKAQGLDPDDQLSIVTIGGSSYFAPKQLVDKNGKILGTVNLGGNTISSTGLAYNQHGYAFGKQFANGAKNYTKEEARDVLARRAYDELLMTHPSAASDPDRLKGFEQAAYEIADGKIKEIEYNNNNSFGLTLYRGVHHGIKDTRGNLRSYKHFADTDLPNKITGFLEKEKRAKRAWNSWDRQGYVKNNPIAGEDPIETGYYEFIKKFGGSFDAVRYLKEHSRKMNKGGSTQGWLDNY